SGLAATQESYSSTLNALSGYLVQGDMPENDLETVLDRQLDGTCQWLTNDTEYKSWRAGVEGAPKLFWLSGKPATGKSTLAAHAIKEFCDCNLDCSYFFFKHGDKSKSSVASMLRSFAFQMASMNPQIRSEILAMHESGVLVDADDERTLWRSIFLSRVFRTNFHQPYFWVIDALDECADFACFLPMLAKIDRNIPLRIIFTSRPSSAIQTLLLQERLLFFAKQITIEDSYQDMRCVLEASARFLPVEDPIACENLIAEILHKSDGCFLWVALVLKELETTHSEQQIQEVLDSVPSEMDNLYMRILDTMAIVPRNRKLAQAILRWTVCAMRPLTVEELKETIRLDVGEVVPRLERAGPDYTSNFYYSEHILRSSSSNDNQITTLSSFVNTNVLSWIEIVAEGGDLYFLTKTAKNLKSYMEQAVRFLVFGSANVLLASGGRQTIALWDTTTGTRLWTVDITERVLALAFNEDDTILMATTVANCTSCWSVKAGEELEKFFVSDQIEDDSSTWQRAPSHAQICGELNLLAVGYGNRPINIWDLEYRRFIGQFHKGAPDVWPGPLLQAMVFNPNPDANLAAASYQDGDLVIFDPWNQKQHAMVEANAHTLAASSDGATLATGDSSGTVHIFDFETLRLLYRSTVNDFNIRAITFASNNIRFFDIRSDHCNVWEPSAIVRQTALSDGSSAYCSEGVVGDAEIVGTRLLDDSQTITAMVSDGADLLFCGKESGSVFIYEAKTGRQTQELYRHAANAAILLLEWNHREGVLASIDRSSRIQVRKISGKGSDKRVAEPPSIDQTIGQAVRQVLFHSSGTKLLVSTSTSDLVWKSDGHRLASRNASDRQSWQWIDCSLTAHGLLLAVDGQIKSFDWETLEESPLNAISRVSLEAGDFPPIVSMKISSQGSIICAHFRGEPRQSLARLRLWSASTSATTAQDPIFMNTTNYDQIANEVKTLIGFHKLLLLFLNQSGWICSIGVEKMTKERAYTRHFFIPYGWHCSGDLIFAVTAKGGVALVRENGIAVFHRGLEFEDRVVLGMDDNAAMPRTEPHWHSPVPENHIDSPPSVHQWDHP
ncbi:MAG: hypothetical protein LQ349_004568, partial [Xanthoria aureola]